MRNRREEEEIQRIQGKRKKKIGREKNSEIACSHSTTSITFTKDIYSPKSVNSNERTVNSNGLVNV